MSRINLSQEEIYYNAEILANRSEVCYLGSIDEEGYPNIKALMKAKNEGLQEIWLSTGTSSSKTNQIECNNKTCIYFVDFEEFAGVMLIGKTKINRDFESRDMVWIEEYIRYYPKGKEDPNFTVLHFTAENGRYFYKGRWPTFEIPFKKK